MNELDQLLLAFDIDLTPMKAGAKAAESIIADLEKKWAGIAAQISSSAAGSEVSQQNVKTAVAQVAVEAQKVVEAVKQQTSAATGTTEEYTRQIAQSKALQASKDAETAKINLQTAALRQQLLVTRQQRLESAESKGGGEQRSVVGSVLSGATRGALGTGIFGSVAGGVVAGEGIATVIEGASRAVETFIEHLRAISVEQGSIVQLQQVFNNLAGTLKLQPGFLDRMRASSEGLISDFDLMKISVVSLSSGYGITGPKLQQLTHDVVVLAESIGKKAPEAVQSFVSAMSSGRLQSLGRDLGVNLTDALKNISPTLGPAARRVEEFSKIIALLHTRALAFGDLPNTLEKVFSQFDVFKKNLDFAFASGFNQSDGLKAISAAFEALTGKVSEYSQDASQFGMAVGNAFGDVVGVVMNLVHIIGEIPAGVLTKLFDVGLLAAAGAVLKYLVSGAISLFGATGRLIGARELEAVSTKAATNALREHTAATLADAAAADKAAGAGAAGAGKKAVGIGTQAAETIGAPAVGESVGETVAASGPPGWLVGGAIVLELAALGAGLALYKRQLDEATGGTVTWGDISAASFLRVRNGWSTVVDSVETRAQEFIGAFKRLVSGIEGVWTRLGTNVQGIVKRMVDTVASYLTGGLVTSLDGMSGKFTSTFTSIDSFVTNKIGGWGKLLLNLAGPLGMLVSAALPTAGEAQAMHTARVAAAGVAQSYQETSENIRLLNQYQQSLKDGDPEKAKIQKLLITPDSKAGYLQQQLAQANSQLSETNNAEGEGKDPGTIQREAAGAGQSLAAANKAMLPYLPHAQEFNQKSLVGMLNQQAAAAKEGTPQSAEQAARAEAAADTTIAQDTLKRKKDLLESEKTLDAAYYAANEITFTQHQNNLGKIAKETQENADTEARQANAAKLYEIDHSGYSKIGPERTSEIKQANDELNTALFHNKQQYLDATNKLQIESDAQAREEQTKANSAELQRAEAHMQAMQDLLSKKLSDGQITPDDYESQNEALIQQRTAKQVATPQANLALDANSPVAVQAAIDSVTSAVEKGQDDISKSVEGNSARQISFIEKVYSTQQKAIESQLAFNKEFGTRFNTGYDTAGLQQSMVDSLNKQLDDYYAEFQKLNNDPTKQFGDDWQKVVAGTEEAYTKLQQYNDMLAQSVAISGPLGNIFSTLGDGVAKAFAPFSSSIKGAKVINAGQELATGGQMLGNLAETNQKIRNIGKGAKTLPPQIQEMVDLGLKEGTAIKSASDPFVDATGSATTKLTSFSDVISQLTEKLNNLLTGTKPSISTSTESTGIPYVDGKSGLSSEVNLGGSGMSPYGGGLGESGALSTPSTLDMQKQLQSLQSYRPEIGVQQTSSSSTVAPDNSAVDAMTKFSSGLQLAVSGIVGFVSALTSAKSAVGGAIGGGTSGGALGSEAKAATSGPDALISGISSSVSSAMPIIGAALGAVMGAFMGEKNAMVQSELTQLKNTYTQMQQAYSSGNSTLQQTISSLEILISEAQADMASSKKGGQQFQDLITQYNQQLQQYLDQAQQLMIQLNEAVGQLVLPNEGADYSSYISSLQQVITQYEQFMGAASTAAQQLQAQQFLQESLANQTQQWTEQLAGDETTAVQDALQLNQLQLQYNQLLQQTAQNERNIMEQGVLTRQQTFAQSKAQQLAQTQYQANLQLDQMNQQLQLQQAKVTAEQTVFNLATTRVGLEAQLLQLQEAASDRSMAGVQALANLVAAMGQGVNSNNSAVSTQNNFIQMLLAMLAANPNAGGDTIAGLLSVYQQYASSGLGANSGSSI
jgi:hypothetical protein